MVRTQTFLGRGKTGWLKYVTVAAWLPLCIFGLPKGETLAADKVVITEGNDGEGTLRDIMGKVSASDTITFASDVYSIALEPANRDLCAYPCP